MNSLHTQYRNILYRWDSPLPDDKQRLSNLAERLGYAKQRIQRDARLVKDIIDSHRLASRVGDLEAKVREREERRAGIDKAIEQLKDDRWAENQRLIAAERDFKMALKADLILKMRSFEPRVDVLFPEGIENAMRLRQPADSVEVSEPANL
jgi:hypothetical protein